MSVQFKNEISRLMSIMNRFDSSQTVEGGNIMEEGKMVIIFNIIKISEI